MSPSTTDQPSPTNAGVARHIVMLFTELDPTTPIGEVVTRRLSEERLIALTVLTRNTRHLRRIPAVKLYQPT